ncbi:sensor histidine kinase [Aquimonas voraii]|uniref:histidine kinase n=1 Tax=Aquimonas voraii TaxID=265719 RepID=A0A1G6Y7X0_9GAMM|nr:histidine kinase [Aquimonas voraii]SDD86594.1 Histidine kinase [Aquimonas voraii]
MSDASTPPPTALAQLIALDEAERRHIAHVLHSEVGQSLTAALLSLQFFAEGGLPADEVEGVADSVREALQQVRALSLQLRPPLLDEIGLEPALRSTLEQIAQRRGFDFELDTRSADTPPPAWLAISLFRWVQALAEATPEGETLRIELRQEAGEVSLRFALRGPLPPRWREDSAARARVLGADVSANHKGLRIRLST